MIYNYQYLGFPNYMKYISNTPYSVNQFSSSRNAILKKNFNTQYNSFHQRKGGVNSTIQNNSKNTNIHPQHTNDAKPFFSIFGINLYFDDILLICIIFFLYNEKVDDSYLLISLVLLLLS